MPLLETLSLRLAPPFLRSVLKLWLGDSPLAIGAGEGVIDVLKKRGENFATADATDRLFRNLASEVAQRLQHAIESEFPGLSDADQDAAVLAVAEAFQNFNLPAAMIASDLDPAQLEQLMWPRAKDAIENLGGASSDLAKHLLRESCAHATNLAFKLPSFQAAATSELLRRTSLLDELIPEMDKVLAARRLAGPANENSNFDVRYRRVLVQHMDRGELFGMRFVGAGARTPEISVSYVSLSSHRTDSSESTTVELALAGVKLVVLRGEAGSGKTTLLRWLAIRAAKGDFPGALAGWNGRVPFFVALRDFATSPFPEGNQLVGYTSSLLATTVPIDWVDAQLGRSGLLLVDGCDEVPPDRRPDLLEWLDKMKVQYPGTVIVLSSRPAVLDSKDTYGRWIGRELKALQFEEVALEPMSLVDSENLVLRWHRAVARDVSGDADEKLQRYGADLIRILRDRAPIRQLASNPLLCSMLCVLNWDRQQSLPDQRMRLYDLVLEMLLDKRDKDRKIATHAPIVLELSQKEFLLDGIAYWMLRNSVVEADWDDVRAQVESLSERFPDRPSPDDVLQELVERSGVLRQPQIRVVDFMHRTFLEFMAARAAVRAGDIPMLASKARESGWIETIVFAAGHAKGKQRDALISQILKPSLSIFRHRTDAEDLAAACCLETASSDLRPDLLRSLRESARRLFPPKNSEIARMLRAAASLDPTLLLNHESAGDVVVAACINCAASVGGTSMLDAIASYARMTGTLVSREIFAAWDAFDEQLYLERVINVRFCTREGVPMFPALSTEAIAWLRFIALNCEAMSAEDLKGLVDQFVESAIISLRTDSMTKDEEAIKEVREAWIRGPSISENHALQLARLQGLQHLSLPECEEGVLNIIASLPRLITLSFTPVDTTSVKQLEKSASLESLSISFRRIPSRGEVDLRLLARNPRLRTLAVRDVYFDGLLLPSSDRLENLTLEDVPARLLKQLKGLRSVSSLAIVVDEDVDLKIDLRSFQFLRCLSLGAHGAATLYLPAGIRELAVFSTPSVELSDPDVVKLESLTVRDVDNFPTLATLIGSPKLEQLSIDLTAVPESLSKEIQAATRRGVAVNQRP